MVQLPKLNFQLLGTWLKHSELPCAISNNSLKYNAQEAFTFQAERRGFLSLSWRGKDRQVWGNGNIPHLQESTHVLLKGNDASYA